MVSRRKVIHLPNQLASKVPDTLHGILSEWLEMNREDAEASQEILAAMNELQNIRLAIHDMEERLIDVMDRKLNLEVMLAQAESSRDKLRKRSFQGGVEMVAAALAIETDLPKATVQRVIEWVMGEPYADAPPAILREDLRSSFEVLNDWLELDNSPLDTETDEAAAR